ncbi:MAG: type II secretion system F family protein [Lentisphaeria bacterium]|nr:type II secretion system F family protein [Lentisphaeria bacterium]
MALFKFKVSDQTGKVNELLIEADSQADATRRIQRRGMLPLQFLGEGAAAGPGGFNLRKRFDVVDFTDRLVPLLDANIPVERALGIVGEGMEDGYASTLVADLRRGLHEGRRLSSLIRDRGNVFPELYPNVVEAGEEAGALPQIMTEMRRFLTDAREMRAFIISSSIYPLFIVVSGLTMLGIVLGVIVPRFARVLVSTTKDPSTSTRLLLALSSFAQSYWWIAPVGIILAGLLTLWIRADERARAVYDEFILRVPLAGRLTLRTNLGRMARTMAILMRSGVHLLETVEIANRVIGNRTLRQSFAGLASELRRGQRLSHALGNSNHIPSFMLRMVAVGEETGDVAIMLERVADRYDEEVKRLVKRMLNLFEPMVIIFLGFFVGGLVLLMFLAIMDMQSGI